MAKEDLIPTNRRTKEEAKELGRKGGIASGKARRLKKETQAVAKAILNELVKTTDGNEVSVRYAMLRSAAQKALKGDIKSIDLLVRLADEMPKPQAELTIKSDKYDTMTDEELIEENKRITNIIENL